MTGSWIDRAREMTNQHLRSHYGRMVALGATAAELQEIASLTYAGNVNRETGEHDVSGSVG